MKDPMFIKKLKFPRTEKTTHERNLFLVTAKIIIAMIKEKPKRFKLTFKSKAGSEKNIHFHFSSLDKKLPERNFFY